MLPYHCTPAHLLKRFLSPSVPMLALFFCIFLQKVFYPTDLIIFVFNAHRFTAHYFIFFNRTLFNKFGSRCRAKLSHIGRWSGVIYVISHQTWSICPQEESPLLSHSISVSWLALTGPHFLEISLLRSRATIEAAEYTVF